MTKHQTAAVLTVFHAPDMIKRGRRQIAVWLRKQAKFIEQYGDVLAGQFVARYLYK